MYMAKEKVKHIYGLITKTEEAMEQYGFVDVKQ